MTKITKEKLNLTKINRTLKIYQLIKPMKCRNYITYEIIIQRVYTIVKQFNKP